MNNTSAIPKNFKILLALVAGIPLVLSFLFVEMQWYPATMIIRMIADDEGLFSVKLAVVLCWAVIMLGVLALALLALVIKKITRPANRQA